MAAKDLDLAIAIALILLGALVLLGRFGIGALLPVLGIALIVFGILILVDVLTGTRTTAIIVIVLGLLLYLDILDVPREITQVIDIIIGVVLIVLGVMQLQR